MPLGRDRLSGPPLPANSRAARRHAQRRVQWQRFGTAAGLVALLVLGVGASQSLGILGGDGSHPQAAAGPNLESGRGRGSITGAAVAAPTTAVPPSTTATPEAATTTTVPPTTATMSAAPTTTAVALGAAGPAAPPAPTPTPAPAPVATDTTTTASDVINAMNQDRAANGLAAQVSDPQLASLAQNWAEHLAAIGALDHQDLDTLRATSMANWESLGENTLDGPAGMSASDMETAWMADAGHRENILRPQMNYVGVGIAVGGDGRVWVVVDFGRR